MCVGLQMTAIEAQSIKEEYKPLLLDLTSCLALAMMDMDMKLSIRQRRYHSTVALNNIAIQLLELNCYSQAVEISYKATRLLRAAASSSVCHGMDDTDGGEELTNAALQQLAHREPRAQLIINMEVLATTTDGLLVRNDNQSAFTFEYLVSAQRNADSGNVSDLPRG